MNKFITITLVVLSLILVGGCANTGTNHYNDNETTQVEPHPFGWGYRVHNPDGSVQHARPQVGGGWRVVEE